MIEAVKAHVRQLIDHANMRWLVRRDIPDVLEIEAGHDRAWSEDDILQCLRDNNCIGMVCEIGGIVVGYMIYELRKSSLKIARFMVEVGCLRFGIGSRMMAALKIKLSPQRRRWLVIDIPESQVAAQLFLRHHKFLATDVIRGAFEHEDAYRMIFYIGGGRCGTKNLRRV